MWILSDTIPQHLDQYGNRLEIFSYTSMEIFSQLIQLLKWGLNIYFFISTLLFTEWKKRRARRNVYVSRHLMKSQLRYKNACVCKKCTMYISPNFRKFSLGFKQEKERKMSGVIEIAILSFPLKSWESKIVYYIPTIVSGQELKFSSLISPYSHPYHPLGLYRTTE